MISIAVLLTCFNRKEKTLSCLRALYTVQEQYVSSQHNQEKQIFLDVYLTDDGCTDGTADAIRIEFMNHPIHILQGNGNLFWAGGMRKAWNEALKMRCDWDYFLLLNDDTDILPNLFDELLSTRDYSIKRFGKEGIISGTTSAKNDHNLITYGGDIWVNRLTARTRRIIPKGTPEIVDVTNANILLVHMSVVRKIGIFYKGFRHGNADYDYSNHARKAGFPVLLTGNVCGRCDNDHDSYEDYSKKIIRMSLQQRRIFFHSPLKSSADYLCFIRRNAPIRYPMVLIGRFLNIYFPKLYYRLNHKR